MFDGQQFISRDVNSFILFLKDDTNFEGRNLWIDNVETSLESNGSGIRWIGKCEEVVAVPEGHPWTADSATSSICNVNTVVPFAKVLTARAADKIVTTLVESAEHSDRRALAKVPDRIITALSAWVYSALKIKIGEKQRTLLTGIEKGDGFELVRKIRVTVDGVTESPLDLLARRKGLLKLEKLEDWNDYKAALLQLIRDWEKAIDDGVVDRYEQFTPFQQREVLRESAHIVHGLDIWMDEERNKDKRIIEVLAYGDVLVKSQKKRLERMKSASVQCKRMLVFLAICPTRRPTPMPITRSPLTSARVAAGSRCAAARAAAAKAKAKAAPRARARAARKAPAKGKAKARAAPARVLARARAAGRASGIRKPLGTTAGSRSISSSSSGTPTTGGISRGTPTAMAPVQARVWHPPSPHNLRCLLPTTPLRRTTPTATARTMGETPTCRRGPTTSKIGRGPTTD